MTDARFGIAGGIGAPRTTSYTKGSKSNAIISRMGISGGIARFARDYSGKTVQTPDVSGGVQSQNATVGGAVAAFTVITSSGGVQARSATVSGVVLNDKTVSGGVQSQSAAVSGTVTPYPLTGYTLTNFTSDYAGLDTDSPFSGDTTYSALVIGDKCHYETLSAPSGSTLAMDGAGQFTITPPSTVIETFDFQIYDASDGTFGTSATITVYPSAADIILSGAVQSQSAVVSGTVTRFDVHNVSGGVQSGRATVNGVIVSTEDLTLLFGGVQSQSAAVAGAVERAITSAGNVQSQGAVVAGDLSRVLKALGGVQAQNSTVSGVVVRRLPHMVAPAKRTIRITPEDRQVKINKESRKFYGPG